MFRSWLNLLSLGAEASQVVWLRSIKVAAGGPAAKREARRMVTEKVIAGHTEGTPPFHGSICCQRRGGLSQTSEGQHPSS